MMKKHIVHVLFITLLLIGIMAMTTMATDVHSDHCYCGGSVTAGGHTCADTAPTWVAWNGEDGISDDTAYLYLSQDVVLDNSLVVAEGKTLYLCLHGNDITLSSGTAGSVITVQNGGTVHICDCTGAGKVIGINARTGTVPGGAVYILSGGTFNFYSGTITDTIVTNKYADRDVYNCGTFNMYGGTVMGSNSAKYKNTKSQWLNIHSYNTGTFNLYGGKTCDIWGGIVWTFEVNDQVGNGKITIEPTAESITLPNRWAYHYYKANSTDEVPATYQRGEWPACVVEACNAYYMPWADYRTKITQVEIREGVKSVGSFAFDGLTNIGGELVIPKTVEYIGHQAFANCKFTKITFAVDEVTNTSDLCCVAQGAFSKSNITELVLPEGLRDIHGSAFGTSTKLETVHLPSTVELMGGWNHHLDYGWDEGSAGYTIFPYCTKLRKITFADEAIRDRFIYNAASYSICVTSNYDQRVHIDAYNGLTAYPYVTDAIREANEGDTVVLVKADAQKKIEVAADTVVVVPVGVTVSIPEGQILYNKGTFVNLGEIDGNGTFNNTGVYITSANAAFDDAVTKVGLETIQSAYLITYNLNGGEIQREYPSYHVAEALEFTLEEPTKTGYIFKGWSGTGLDGDENHNVTVSIPAGSTQEYIFTANWTAYTYAVKLEANGGSGVMANMSVIYDVATELSANEFVYKNKRFTGWNTAADGSGTAYADGQRIHNLTQENGATIILYAQWEDKPDQTIVFDTTDRNVTYGDGELAPRTAAAEGAITYTSSNPSVAKVDADGVVTVLHVGQTVITANAAETATYASAVASYQLIVTPKMLTIKAEDCVAYVGDSPELRYTVDGFVDGDSFLALPLCATNADMNSVGDYAIVPSGGDAGENYTISYVNGTLSVCLPKYTVTYKVDGVVVKTEIVESGKNATAPEIPAKEGYNETAPKWDRDGKNVTCDITINAVYTKNQPGECTDVTPDTNVGGGKIVDEIAELKEKVPFAQEENKKIEYGTDVKIWMEMQDISTSVSQEDKIEIDKKLDDGEVAMYLNIAMFKQVGEDEVSHITELSDKVQIVFKLDDSYINKDKNVTRTYRIIHVHESKTEIIIPVFDEQTQTLTFWTDRFSTYAVVYTDVASNLSAEMPATGDQFQPVFWAVCMALSIIGVVALLHVKRRYVI